MSWIANLFNKDQGKASSAQTAKDRLSVIVASDHNLSSRLTNDKIERMKREILGVVNQYVQGVDITDVEIQHRNEQNVDVLEMNINLPDSR